LASGEVTDARMEDGLIVGLGSPSPATDDEILDLDGYLLLPALVEPHTHLDKALLGDQVVNATGDLAGGILAMEEFEQRASSEEIVRRATRAALLFSRRGVTAIRSHVVCGGPVGFRALAALVEVRRQLRGRIDIQLVAQNVGPAPGDSWNGHRGQLRRALELGADLVGGTPHLDRDPLGCMQVCIDEARRAQRPVDLHMDEALDQKIFDLSDLLRIVARQPANPPVTVSHCVSLSLQPDDVVHATAKAMASAGISLVTLPQTNLYLNGRGAGPRASRALAPVDVLLRAGVVVAGGSDNVRDPFNPLNRADPLETVSLLITVAHLSVVDAFEAVTSGARRVMGLPAVRLEAGSPADVVAIRAATLTEAIAEAPESRIVWKAGRMVSRTCVECADLPVPNSEFSGDH
jgi:cytosine deaminase